MQIELCTFISSLLSWKYRKFKWALGNMLFTHPFFLKKKSTTITSITEVFSRGTQNNSGKSDVSAVSWEQRRGAVTQSGAILVRGLHLHYYSRKRPTSRNQEPHRGTWFNMKPPWAVLLYNDCHRNTAVSTYGDSKLNIDIVHCGVICQTIWIYWNSSTQQEVRFHIYTVTSRFVRYI